MGKDIAVHRIVAEASGNLPYLILLNFFNDATPDIARHFFGDEYTRMKTEKFHKDLYEAIKNRQQEAAKRTMMDALAGAAMAAGERIYLSPLTTSEYLNGLLIPSGLSWACCPDEFSGVTYSSCRGEPPWLPFNWAGTGACP